jgi:hypothetical protein
VCTGCTPPLTYHGGAIMGTPAQAGAITVTPIYWAPAPYAFTPAYKALINQYIADIAADSGKASNVYSVNTEYARAPGTGSQLVYSITAGTPINDATAYPAQACVPPEGFTACVTDAQITARISSLLVARGLPADLAHIYPVFFPPGVDLTDGSGGHAAGAWCGIHGAIVSANPAGPLIYALEPFPGDGCLSGQFPAYGLTGDAGTAPADSEVGILSHEINEAITDPQLSLTYGWYDSSGHEIGDECSETFGPPLGSTDT